MSEHDEQGGETATAGAPLLGRWRGTGIADFPTIDRVGYRETLDVTWDAERGVLCYEQRVHLDDGSASHRETGFLRFLDDDQVQLWNAQDNGRTEVLRGPVSSDPSDGSIRLDLRSVAFGNDPRMLESAREIRVEGDRLRYRLVMATTTAPDPAVRTHLEAELERA